MPMLGKNRLVARQIEINAIVDFIRAEHKRFGTSSPEAYMLWKRNCNTTTISSTTFEKLYTYALQTQKSYTMTWKDRWCYWLFGDNDSSLEYTDAHNNCRHNGDESISYYMHHIDIQPHDLF